MTSRSGPTPEVTVTLLGDASGARRAVRVFNDAHVRPSLVLPLLSTDGRRVRPGVSEEVPGG